MAGKGDNTQWVDMPLLLDWEVDERWEENTAFEYTGANMDSTADAVFLSVRMRQRLLNWIPEKSGNKVSLRARPFVQRSANLWAKGAGSLTNPRGLFWGSSTGRLCEVWNDTLYVWSTDDTYTTEVLTGTVAAGGPCGFTEGINTAGTSYIFVSAVGESVQVTTSGNTTISDADFPASIIPMPIFLDSYICVAQQSSRSIFNSAVGDPTTWTATGFINTEESGGNIVALARHKKFIVALCEDHIEFFRDAGIPAPNSPLQRVPEYTSLIGCINRATVATIGDIIYFAGREGSVFNFYKIQDMKVTKIGTPSTSYLLNLHGGSANANDIPQYGVITVWNQSNSLHNFGVAYIIPLHGKNYYLFVSNAGRTTTNTTLSQDSYPALIYDPELNWWGEIGMIYRNTGLTNRDVPGGWAFPYGTFIHVPTNDASALSQTFLMQNAYGGADNDGQICYLSTVNNAGEMIDTSSTGGVIGSSTTTPLQIQWPWTDFGTGSKKDISGLQLNQSARGNNALSGTGIFIGLGWYGQYLPNEATPTWAGINLSSSDYTAPLGEQSQIIRNPLISNFYGQMFFLQQVLDQWKNLESVRFRITTHEEQ